jgi:hypothetical protein
MADSPAAGWHSDPENPDRMRFWDGQKWTDQVQAMAGADPSPTKAPGPKRRLPGLAIAGMIVAALLVVGGLTAIIVNALGSGDPTVQPSRSAMGLPSDWSTYTSRSGAVTYSYDPAWYDLWTAEEEAQMIEAMPIPGADIEVAGEWMTDGSPLTGGTALVIIVVSDGTPVPDNLDFQAMGFVVSNAQAIGTGDYDIVLNEGFTTTNGYDAWRIDYTMDSLESTMYSSVIAFRHEVTMGFLYTLSLEGFDSWIPDLLAVTDSLVVVKPPVSP